MCIRDSHQKLEYILDFIVDLIQLQEFDKKFPISHEISLDHGMKPVLALGLDPSGARVVTGGYDYEVKFWDFAGMDSSFRSFRTLQPCERCVTC